jgi:ABC-type antimicrobial peptide transport system permease subunit
MERLLKTGESNRAFLVLLMGILYLIVGFGILGTVIMMTNERLREFCMMISLGMSRVRLAIVVAVELFIKSLIGATAAIAVILPIMMWLHANPIPLPGDLATTMIQFGMEPYWFVALDADIYVNQLITILVISLITVIYPVRKILKLNLNKKRQNL